MSSSQSNFVIENIVNRYTTFQQIFREYNHKCRQEYTVSRALCVYCFHRLEASRGFPKKMIPAKCVCLDIPSYVSEQCVHCAEIKEEIVFIKNEIRRTSTTYGIEVAETLETNPLFGQTIDKLVLRIEILEQVLLRQLIDTETAARKEQFENNEDNVSELSEEPELARTPESEGVQESSRDDLSSKKDDEEVHQVSDDETIFSCDYVRTHTLSASQIHVNIPQPTPEPDTESVDDEIESITRVIEQINVNDTENESVNSRKRPRPESPELWLYDGSMA